jgi:PAS domain S-box-containing protein
MNKRLKILHLEDLESDAELVERALVKGDVQFEKRVVDNRVDFFRELREFAPDIILSDHSLPSFNSTEALKMLKDEQISIPFILITATISEEFAVEVMKGGAYDYILKDRMQRLPNAIYNAIERHTLEMEREKYIESLRTSEANLRTILENATTAYILIDTNFKVVTFNPLASEYAKRDLHSDLQPNTYSIDYFQGERRPTLRRMLNDAINGINSSNFEVSFFKEEGHLKWYDCNIHGIMNSEQRIVGVILSLVDITERKRMDFQREKMTGDLIQRNKDLEQFAYIVSHNLRAPVANIIGFSTLMDEDWIDETMQRNCIYGISTAVKKLDEVVHDLNHILQIRREISENKETVYFSDLIESIKLSLGGLLKAGDVQIEYDFSGADKMETIKSYLYSIFYNLISNSIKYRREDVAPVIRVTSHKDQDRLELTFTDNGMGIDLEANKDMVFGLYKRFHNHVEGKGMGLFMVKTQVETLDGRITVDSKINQGTQFKIEFSV